MLVTAQDHASCPLDHHWQEVYENPLFERWLSKYDVKFYYLDLEVFNENTFIEGAVTILIEAVEPMDTVVFQLIDALEIAVVEIGGSEIPDFRHVEDVVYIPADAAPGDLLSVTITYSGNAGQDRGFFAGITSAYDNTNEQWVTYTLSEPLNARDWFPVKQVLADKADSVWVDLTCDRSLMAGSNGVLTAVDALPGDRHTFKWRSAYPIAYYLISMAVADYRDYSFYAPLTNSNDSVLVQNFIYDDDSYFAEWKERIDATGGMISLFSGLVVDYPFFREKYGHAVAPMGGGMEHQTMTTLANFNFNLVAHELAHQWFGNSITCGNWQDIWINEGFASYFEYIALEHLHSAAAAENWLEYAYSVAINETGSVYVPEEEADDPGRVFSHGLSYKKGAFLLHMIRYELNNDTLFFDVLRTYSEAYRDSVATAVEFREVLEHVSGRDFSCFFDQWYYGNGYPVFTILGTMEEDTLVIQSHQATSVSSTPLFRMHFDLAVQTDKGEHVVRLYQEQNEQTFDIPVHDFVTGIDFDPFNQLLAKGNASMQLTDNKEFVVGPNPFRSTFLLRFSQFTGQVSLEVMDMKGTVVKSSDITTNPFKVDLAELSDGFYMILIRGPQGTFREKVIKVSDN